MVFRTSTNTDDNDQANSPTSVPMAGDGPTEDAPLPDSASATNPNIDKGCRPPECGNNEYVDKPSASVSCSPHVDLGEVIKNGNRDRLSFAEKLEYMERHFKPDEQYNFHKKTVFKKSKDRDVVLTFQHSWLKEYPWLIYSPLLEGGLCKYCVLFPPKNAKVVPGQLVTQPFQSYEKAKGSDRGILDKHHSLQYHKDAMESGLCLIRTSEKPESSIEYCMSDRQQQLFDSNSHILKSIIEVILLCGRQNIALRGHRDDNTCLNQNRGNFIAMLELIAKHDQVLLDHLQHGSKNAKYTSKTVQNELIEIIGLEIRKNLVRPLQADDAVFAIMADEVTDPHANQEVLTVCLRFVDESRAIKEVFFDFQKLERATGETITNGIIQSLRKYGVDILKCRGQSYDGAACMSSEGAGVHGRIKSIAPRALYTHCKSHVLNLSIAASCKHPPIRNMVDSINECFMFFDNSPKRQRFLEKVSQQAATSLKQKLQGLCKTRWVERHTCYETLYELYEVVCSCLEAIVTPSQFEDIYEGGTWSWDRESRIKAQGLSHTLRSFEFIVAFLTAKNTLETVKGLATKLQKSDLDIYEAYSSIDNTIGRIQRFRDNVEAEFKETFQLAEALSEKVGGSGSMMPRIATGRQRHRDNAPAETPEIYYCRNVQIPFLDHLLLQMNDRFSQESRTCAAIFVLVPDVISKMSDEELCISCEKLLFWKEDLPTPSSLKPEMKEWRYKWTSVKDGRPQNLIDCLKCMDRDMYPNLYTLLVIGCTLPVGSASAERSFSCLRRTKTYLRSAMNEERLSGLCLMNIHSNITVGTDEIMKTFIQRNRRRMFMHTVLYD